MRTKVLAAAIGLWAVGAAGAEDAGAPTPAPSATQASPSPVAIAPSRAKVFLISPEESQEAFMCDGGRLQSLLPTAIAEHRIVSVTLLDQTKAAIPDGVWTSAYGFRLAHKQSVLINVVMICGN